MIDVKNDDTMPAVLQGIAGRLGIAPSWHKRLTTDLAGLRPNKPMTVFFTVEALLATGSHAAIGPHIQLDLARVVYLPLMRVERGRDMAVFAFMGDEIALWQHSEYQDWSGVGEGSLPQRGEFYPQRIFVAAWPTHPFHDSYGAMLLLALGLEAKPQSSFPLMVAMGEDEAAAWQAAREIPKAAALSA